MHQALLQETADVVRTLLSQLKENYFPFFDRLAPLVSKLLTKPRPWTEHLHGLQIIVRRLEPRRDGVQHVQLLLPARNCGAHRQQRASCEGEGRYGSRYPRRTGRKQFWRALRERRARSGARRCGFKIALPRGVSGR
ncbi:hypothetical protein HPB48_021493 [Haemaphysalis longicornis]|uniref:Uncharacterized protein n=1 Tax=Haemaphysalis longicornis TaxID=44386 RepID=A0A9J6GM92_HAELO|nr:hypothetical protein HPB48_021493 [Haemaphysalis longicornis]